MIRLLRWVLAAIAAAAAVAWAVQATWERWRPTYVVDPDRPELRLRARLSRAEHRAIVAAQDATILAYMNGNEHPAPGA